MYEPFRQQIGDLATIVIPGSQAMSYFSGVSNICWFLEPEFATEIHRIHKLVGNAMTENRYIVVGTGSTQLFQAALYALSSSDAAEPMSVVSASYPMKTDFLCSGLYHWAGDANSLKGDSYIEVVCYPNNPDGLIDKAELWGWKDNSRSCVLLAWPQYTPVSEPGEHDIMLFTMFKATGHAGSTLGLVIVKDANVAKKVTKFVEMNTIGVSKDSQLRAAKIIKVVSNGYELRDSKPNARLFDYGRKVSAARWEILREVVKTKGCSACQSTLWKLATSMGRKRHPGDPLHG